MEKSVKMKAWGGEIFCDDEIELHPIQERVIHEVDSEWGQDSYYEVSGTIYDIEMSLEMKFEKFFKTEEKADVFFKEIIKRYPLSEVLLKKEDWQEIRIYS